MTSAQFGQKLIFVVIASDLVWQLHELASCQLVEKCWLTSSQVGMKCKSHSVTCSRTGTKFSYDYFKNHLYPSWAQVQKVVFSLWTNWRQVAQRNYSQLGNNSDRYFALLQIGKQCKPVQVYSFSQNHLRMLFRKLLVGATSPIPFEIILRWWLLVHSERFHKFNFYTNWAEVEW